MPYYVAKISKHDEGTSAYLFDADNETQAEDVAATLANDMNATLDEVVTLDEYMSDGEIRELCAF